MAQLFKAHNVYYDQIEWKWKAQNNPMILNMDLVESVVQEIGVDVEGEPQFILVVRGNSLRVVSKYLEKLMELVE